MRDLFGINASTGRCFVVHIFNLLTLQHHQLLLDDVYFLSSTRRKEKDLTRDNRSKWKKGEKFVKRMQMEFKLCKQKNSRRLFTVGQENGFYPTLINKYFKTRKTQKCFFETMSLIITVIKNHILVSFVSLPTLH